jgi:NADH:ubiquinone oxidoreductase subunit E
MSYKKVDAIIEQHGNRESEVISILQDIQQQRDYLAREVLEHVAEKMAIPLAKVYRIATFYNAFSLKPRGRHLINVCLGTACHVRGGERILEKLERDLKVERGETTQDGRFTLERVHCLGCCSLSPVMVVDGRTFGRLNQNTVVKLLKDFN